MSFAFAGEASSFLSGAIPMSVINTNIKALYTQSALKIAGRESATAMQQLSTGKRINSAKDDAAGLAIASRMTQHIRSLNQAVRNAGDAVSLIQTAEGATNEMTSMLQRMSELAVQSSNATYSADQRGYLDLEFQQLKQEIVRIAEHHEWNGSPILSGTAGAKVVGTSSSDRPAVASAADIKTLNAFDLKINGVAIRASSAADDTVSNTISATSSAAGSAIAIAAAINASQSETGVYATANPASTSGLVTTIGTVSGAVSMFVNGVDVPVTLSPTDSVAVRRSNVIAAINTQFDAHGVKASDNGEGGVELTTPDGRNLAVWFNSSNGLSSSDLGLYLAPAVEGIAAATATSTGATTAYGSVSLISNQVISEGFKVEYGDSLSGNFADLGFTADTFASVLDTSGGAVNGPSVGRLSFQVGPGEDQVITVDLHDFGRNGFITGGVTHDAGEDNPAVNIKTVEGSAAVIEKINKALNQVSASRATMGATMNRLEHVMDNLLNVSVNSEASRSQIEDADYAVASTALARTQIMQQAATAILAQANTDQQSVLKLLQ
jgi:flagellin